MIVGGSSKASRDGISQRAGVLTSYYAKYPKQERVGHVSIAGSTFGR